MIWPATLALRLSRALHPNSVGCVSVHVPLLGVGPSHDAHHRHPIHRTWTTQRLDGWGSRRLEARPATRERPGSRKTHRRPRRGRCVFHSGERRCVRRVAGSGLGWVVSIDRSCSGTGRAHSAAFGALSVSCMRIPVGWVGARYLARQWVYGAAPCIRRRDDGSGRSGTGTVSWHMQHYSMRGVLEVSRELHGLLRLAREPASATFMRMVALRG
ncbi:hypothetical protein C8T65DRAFT_654603 [Cerioporus squamosus]|nr:hypothetical protein C8T65DRAFT_654603 [Cerioporus squamosus]